MKNMKKGIVHRIGVGFICFALCMAIVLQNGACAQAQQGRGLRADANVPAALGAEEGFINFNTPDFKLRLVRSSQTIAALEPNGANGFDFTPADILKNRAGNGFFHIGDLTMRIRTENSGEWKGISTVAVRKPVKVLSAGGGTLASADLAATLPADCPFQIIRSWLLDDGKLVLKFDIRNVTTQPVQIGALGIPLIFNNYITGRSLEQAHAICSFSDPSIGLDGGYVQVTRLNGRGPVLIVVPDGNTPFEAYNPLLNDPTERNQTFEGFYEWMVHSRAFADNEWKEAQPWNVPTSVTIGPGESRTYGLKFLVADQIRNIGKILADNKRPVAVGIPGYVLPTDLDARLFIKYPQKVVATNVEPAGAITINENPPASGWMAYTLRGKTWGRARLTITYGDGRRQSINYFVIKSAAQAVADMGRFLNNQQWFSDPCDYFHRGPSFMSYDREINEVVKQDSRVWIAGLGDEGGSGPYLAAAMKIYGQPDKAEIEKFSQFVDKTLWGGIQYSKGTRQYGVRKSMFYYAPNELPAGFYRRDMDWSSWTSWNKRGAEAVDRSFNYLHVAASYWSMYRLARNNTGLVTNRPWDWYLTRACETSLAMVKLAPRYAGYGQMEGDIFLQILLDLKREQMTEQANALEAAMKKRVEVWSREAYPFGSEMAWDSTGQEEVYAWCKYFGYNDKAKVTLDAVLGYMPTVPHWGYNGNARRYWDFLYGGKLSRYERQIHHYGSGINAIPVLAEYREHPDDFYLLRVGYGGTMGALTNIDQEGFASAAFHAWPSTLKWDAYSGDYGPNFFGHAFNTATYIVKHPQFGWLAFGGNIFVDGDVVKVVPLDSFRTRIYAACLGLWLTLDAGKFEEIEINTAKNTVRIGFAAATQYTPNARLRIEQPAGVIGIGTFKPAGELNSERGAFVIPLKNQTTWVELKQ
jgi:hypothetical protein